MPLFAYRNESSHDNICTKFWGYTFILIGTITLFFMTMLVAISS